MKIFSTYVNDIDISQPSIVIRKFALIKAPLIVCFEFIKYLK